jgi:flagellar basal-body rod modification protein FlgD
MPAVASVTNNYTNATDSSDTLSTSQTLSQADFLKLLVTQMTSQDPLNPQTDTQMAAQMAQYTSLQQSSAMSTNIATMLTQQQSMLAQQQLMQASSMLGGTVTLQKDSTTVTSGVVEAVQIQSDGTPKIVVDGTAYNLSQVLTISPTQP